MKVFTETQVTKLLNNVTDGNDGRINKLCRHFVAIVYTYKHLVLIVIVIIFKRLPLVVFSVCPGLIQIEFCIGAEKAHGFCNIG